MKKSIIFSTLFFIANVLFLFFCALFEESILNGIFYDALMNLFFAIISLFIFPAKCFFRSKIRLRKVLLLLLIAVVAVLLKLTVNGVEGNFVEYGVGEWQMYFLFFTAPVAEEIAIRGYMFLYPLRRFKGNVYVLGVLSSVFFVIGHFFMHQHIYFFLMALLFCFVFYRLGNLLYAILIHFFVNTLFVVIDIYSKPIISFQHFTANNSVLSIFTLSILLLFLLLYIYRNNPSPFSEEVEQKD